MKAGLILLIAFVIVLSQTGCILEVNGWNISPEKDKSPDIRDGGFVSADPCGPPCFFEIVPGITTKNQAISLLQARALYSDCHEYDNREQGGVRGIACSNISIGLQNDFDIVENIGFTPAQTITVEKAITRHGEPSAVLVTDVSYAENEFVTSMILYYDAIKVELVLAEQNSGAFDLTPTTLVANIGYSDEGSYDLNRRYYQAWKGYGTYEQWNP